MSTFHLLTEPMLLFFYGVAGAILLGISVVYCRDYLEVTTTQRSVNSIDQLGQVEYSNFYTVHVMFL